MDTLGCGVAFCQPWYVANVKGIFLCRVCERGIICLAFCTAKRRSFFLPVPFPVPMHTRRARKQEQEEEERKRKLRQAEEDKKKAEEEAKLEKERQVSRYFHESVRDKRFEPRILSCTWWLKMVLLYYTTL